MSILSVKNVTTDIVTYLSETGSVFRVFDRQDSGCVSYGVAIRESDAHEGGAETKYFVKHSEIERGISALRDAARFNQAVWYPPTMPRLVNWFESHPGFNLVYEWVEGEVLSSPEFRGALGRANPESPFYRFHRLPASEITRVLNLIYETHVYLEEQGYVAVDFYDGCIIYNFQSGDLHLCDFDHYSKGPFILEKDRNPGSSRFMAPEEYVRGSPIDSRTNVFTMGSTALVFLADAARSPESWRGTPAQYDVCLKATSRDRNDRYPTIKEFYRAWQEASLRC